MCWTAGASLALGAAGIGVAGYAHKQGKSKYITIPLVYFSLMELLQFFSYFSINQCGLESNTTLTFLSYAHIAFQPVFTNMFLMATSPQGVAQISLRMKRIVLGLSLLASFLLMLKLVPFFPETLCALGQTICGPVQMCTKSGAWHLAWFVPQYNLPLWGDGMIYYGLASFVLPLVYGAWRGVAVLIATGPVLAYILASGNPNEWPAIWCLYSAGLILIGMSSVYKHTLEKLQKMITRQPTE